MKTKIAAVLVAVVVVGMAFGASAFTTATVDRSSTITVDSDSGGLIGLTPDPDATMVTNTSNQIAIDMTSSTGESVNVDSKFVIGNNSDSTNAYAFKLTNNDDNSRDVTFSYTATSDSDSNANVKFNVHNSTGSSVATFDENTDATVTSVASGATHYVVLTVDTSAGTTGDDLGGTLTIKAE